ncbi:hypothetical protein Mal52_51310 [Symmachiella dynata]|uniref:Uncharacterized protein n=1 Tax=Symmachiella dynata TaxID=2527995 RepID=A0A517ZVX4_9PLAN|nr:hypothetical protein [Symmachiella dynata]QDU46609.1 hypothetical protein Mal52_51310 [Symmachiella dynata]
MSIKYDCEWLITNLWIKSKPTQVHLDRLTRIHEKYPNYVPSEWPNFAEVQDIATRNAQTSQFSAGLRSVLDLINEQLDPPDYLQGQTSDPAEESLTGQALLIYRFLKSHKGWTSYDTLKEQRDFWRNSEFTTDAGIKGGLVRLQKGLGLIDTPCTLRINNKERRTRLENLPKNQ